MVPLNQQHFKDKSPIETVKFISNILKTLDIETVEEWIPHNDIDVASLRLYIKGTSLGSNGKGINKEYALASAYAELLERYQNMRLGKTYHVRNNKFSFYQFNDERHLTATEIVKDNSAFLKMFFKRRDLEDASFEERVKAFSKIQRMDYNLTENKENYLSLPFYNVSKDKVEYLPFYTYTYYYASNGMCAGNTTEEALVQGLSEIVERYVQKQIIMNQIALPDIEESFIKKYPYVYKMYMKLKENEGYTIKLLDCSLGGRFSVAALAIIEKGTGRYGVKLGSHPDYGIAMERAITEAAQGNNIFEYVNRSNLDFSNTNVINETNILNGFKTGLSQFPYQMFLKPSTYEFKAMKSIGDLSNKEILQEMICSLDADGFEVLIRDVSYLDFPSYHIIIPGLSEIIDITDKGFSALNTRFHISKLLNDPKQINEENYRYIISVMDYYANSHLENTMDSYYGFNTNFEFPAEEYGMGWLYFTAMCHVLVGEYEKATTRMKILIQRGDKATLGQFYYGVLQYIEGMSVIKDHYKVMNYLNQFFDKKICKQIDGIFKSQKEVITNQYPKIKSFDHNNCTGEQANEYSKYLDLMDKYKNVQLSREINQRSMRKHFYQSKEEKVC